MDTRTAPLESRSNAGSAATDRAIIISSDGHAGALMADYRPYLESRFHDDFDQFCAYFNSIPMCVHPHLELLRTRADQYVVDEWIEQVEETGKMAGLHDPAARIRFQDELGFSAEVLFPEGGLPFRVGGQLASTLMKYQPTAEQLDAAFPAYNRWLADFISVAPDRFAAMAVVSFNDIDAAVREIRWAKDAGFRGVLLPHFPEEQPIYDLRYEPIWNVCEELGLPLNAHAGNSSVSNRAIPLPDVPGSSKLRLPLLTQRQQFNARQLLYHMVWGGVLERHPNLHFAFTEFCSAWLLEAKQSMDYSYEGSYLSREVHEVLKLKPSEYISRQCSLGSSLFSRAEVEARHLIGLEQMAIGFDYPHHEGAWAAGPGPLAYLRATFGAAGVPVKEAEVMLTGNAASLWDFDLDALRGIADRVGPKFDELLEPPTVDEYPRGDVHKPFGNGNGFA